MVSLILPTQARDGNGVLTRFSLAGGQAVNSKMERMLEVVPENIHDKSGIFMGSFDEIEKVKAFHKK